MSDAGPRIGCSSRVFTERPSQAVIVNPRRGPSGGIGSAGNPAESAAFATTFERWDPEANVLTRGGGWQRIGLTACDVAFVAEPTTVTLLSNGLGLIGYWSRRMRGA